MTIPTLFLRASEVGNTSVVALPTPLNDAQSPALGASRGHGAEMAPDLLVPQIRPGLEFVLGGIVCPRCSEGYINDGHDCDVISVPVRAFEMIAGEPGREREINDPIAAWRELKDNGKYDLLTMIYNYLHLHWNIFGIEWRLGDEPVARCMREEMGL